MEDSQTAEAIGVNPIALAFLVVMIIITWTSTRQNAVKALLVTAAFIPLGQQFNLAGLHFPFFRIMIAAGLGRVLMRGEMRDFQMNHVDRIFIAWGLSGWICTIIRGQFVPACSFAYNSFGTYFLVRLLMPDVRDVIPHLRFLAMVVFGISICMFIEYTTRHNPFFVFGGVPAVLDVRGDRVRCQGPFRSANLGGAFPSTLFPLMIGLWFQEARSKTRAVFGMIGCVVATILSNSSGPALCLIAAVIGYVLWKVRKHMSLFRRVIVLTLVGFAMVMKAPVWYLIARLSDLVGGGGWHRAFIIDMCVSHFGTWWLIGTSHTALWAPQYLSLLVDPDNLDITNHYVAQAVTGGLPMLALFIALLVACFKIVGRTVDYAKDPPLKPVLIWGLGVTLGSHCTGFFTCSYYDQIQVFWFWFLAVVAAVAPYAVPGEQLQPVQDSQAGGESELAPVFPDGLSHH